MSRRPWKVDSDKLAILQREAELRKQITSNKKLAQVLGLSPGYVAKVLWHLAHGRNIHSVPRGTTTTEELRQLMRP